MTMGWVIFLAGLGTYAMRSTGIWVSAQVVQLRWLGYLPLAVILVMAVNSVSGLTGTGQTTLAVVIASAVVVVANLKHLPLVVCIALGCAAFGLCSS